eukprot:TRINITY_DN25929_c0_g1_i1.p1 TRINITY_DN25929_c0_g1~~TRINITY_DN25929_c0_g1_i1.p1  ORF type:complete len:481 (-),score=71.43 TRINITY_DN25929_c0_g1_i1:68-1510(-)
MSGPWREMKMRAEQGEKRPLRHGARNSGGAARKSRSGALKQTVEEGDPDEQDLYETGFVLRAIEPATVRVWLAFQAVGLLFHWLLWSEVASHLGAYEAIIERECASRSTVGTCVGPSWSLAYSENVVLSPGSRHEFAFVTRSSPPTFLASVLPTATTRNQGEEPRAAPPGPPEEWEDRPDVRWSLNLERTVPRLLGTPLSRRSHGHQAFTFEDLSAEARQAASMGLTVEWKATLSLEQTAHLGKARFLLYVEDTVSQRFNAIHMSPQCVYSRSWKAFNEQRRGVNHRALAWCRFLLGVLFAVGCGAAFIVHQEYSRPRSDGAEAPYAFHRVVLAKFVLQDLPQQICLVLYIFGWYEASGLRCQLCLFAQDFCGSESPFHLSNCAAGACTLLSACANQLLVRPAVKKVYTDEDVCTRFTLRAGATCVAVLPFTTAMCFASGSLLPVPTFFHVLFAVPCFLGWMFLIGLVCVPLLICCDDEI